MLRFRILKHGIECDSIDHIHLITQACGLLHNFIQGRHGHRETSQNVLSRVRIEEVEEIRSSFHRTGVTGALSESDASIRIRPSAITWRDDMASEAWKEYENYLRHHLSTNAVSIIDDTPSLVDL